MILDYYTLLCPEPISLSIGRIKSPTLREIGKDLSFKIFTMYQVYLKLNPEGFYTELHKEEGKEIWDSFSDEAKEEMTMYDILLNDEYVRNIYLQIFNFFFLERVVFLEDLFLIVNTDDYDIAPEEINYDEYLVGAISKKTFQEILDILQQICCIYTYKSTDMPKPKFKNKKAETIYNKIQKAKEEEQERVKKDPEDAISMSLPNVISSVAASEGNSLNIVNIWDATLFQLYDQFNKTQLGKSYYINSVRVAVWGDENKEFDQSLWYKNTFDKKQVLDF